MLSDEQILAIRNAMPQRLVSPAPDWYLLAFARALESALSQSTEQGERDAESGDEHPAEDALRAIACWLGVGGYNAPTVDAEAFKRKIMEGVSMLAEGVPDALRYRWLRVRGAAFAGDPKRHLEDGLVYRIDNLDEAIDREMRAAMSPHGDGVNYTRAEGGEDGNDGVETPFQPDQKGGA